MDVLTEGVRKEVPASMMFADDIVLCGGREVDMTEYLDTWRTYLEERGMKVSRPKTQFMDFNNYFEQNRQGNREPVKKTRGGTGKSYAFQIPRREYGSGRWYGK